MGMKTMDLPQDQKLHKSFSDNHVKSFQKNLILLKPRQED